MANFFVFSFIRFVDMSNGNFNGFGSRYQIFSVSIHFVWKPISGWMRKAYDKIESKTAHNHFNLDIILYTFSTQQFHFRFRFYRPQSTQHFINPRAINFKSSMNGVEVLSEAHKWVSIRIFHLILRHWVSISANQTKMTLRLLKKPKQEKIHTKFFGFK